MDKKYILCYGDSNTWGVLPKRDDAFKYHERIAEDKRWTGILQQILGPEYGVLVDGNCGRTTVWDDPIEGDKSGKRYLPPLLNAQQPLDLVMIMLGTNDLKPRFDATAFTCATGIKTLVKIVKHAGCGRNGGCPKILVIAPIHVKADRSDTWLHYTYGEDDTTYKKSLGFAKHYKDVADAYGCGFLDAALYAEPSDEDGVHMRLEDHPVLAKAIADKVLEMLAEEE